MVLGDQVASGSPILNAFPKGSVSGGLACSYTWYGEHMVMVDQIIVWPTARPPFDKGSCHLTTDGDLEELHAFAEKIGLRRSWFQEHSKMPHYDLTPSRRLRALREGSVFVEARQQAIRRRARRQTDA